MNWKPIKNWENIYEVSDDGSIKNIKTNKILCGDKNSVGYRRVVLYSNGKKERKFVHRIVAETFLPKVGVDLIVNHKDGDKLNNNISNLEWVTRTENNIHALRHGLCGEWKGEFKVIYLDGTCETLDNQRQFARRIGVSSTTVRNWINEKYKIKECYGIKYIGYCS